MIEFYIIFYLKYSKEARQGGSITVTNSKFQVILVTEIYT